MAVEVTAHERPQTDTGVSPGLLGDLQRRAVRRHDVVAADHALGLHAEDLIEIDAAEGHEGRARVRGRAAELGIEGGQEALAQVAIGGRHGGDARHRSSLTSLSCSVRWTRSLRARLGRVAEDVALSLTPF